MVLMNNIITLKAEWHTGCDYDNQTDCENDRSSDVDFRSTGVQTDIFDGIILQVVFLEINAVMLFASN